MLLHKESFAQIERTCLPRRRTIKRWEKWLHDQFLIHSHRLRSRFPDDLGKTPTIKTFWSTCFEFMSLAKAMLYVQQGTEVVP
jgi:hypothetical protein